MALFLSVMTNLIFLIFAGYCFYKYRGLFWIKFILYPAIGIVTMYVIIGGSFVDFYQTWYALAGQIMLLIPLILEFYSLKKKKGF